eukprot:16449743-Heterocapsa_arctica.AAC.1
MEDWTLQTVQILEGPKKEAGAVQEVKAPEQNVERMQVVVMQKDVPLQRTCLMPKEDRLITKGDIGPECGEKSCITCNARDADKGFMNSDFEIYGSTILEHFRNMKGDVQYRNWTVQHNIDNLSSLMASMSISERRNLGSMGAMRLTRKQAIHYLQTNGSL